MSALCVWFVSGVTIESLRWHVASEHGEGHRHGHEASAGGDFEHSEAADRHEHQLAQPEDSWLSAPTRSHSRVTLVALAPFQPMATTRVVVPYPPEPPRLGKPPHLEHFSILLI